VWSGWQEALVFVQPVTVMEWQRTGFRKHWTRLSGRGRRGRSATAPELRQLSVGLPAPELCHSDAEGFWEIEDLVSGAPYRRLLSATVIRFDKGALAIVADADDPVDIGLVMPRQ